MEKFLVVHDYGMGGLWWWVWARSAEEIVESLAEVEVVDPASAGELGDLAEVRLGALPADSPLAELRDQRSAQRGQPGYGALAGRERVWLRDDDAEFEGTVFLTEVGPDGRQLRLVEQPPDGAAVRTDDFVLNPPIDLRDPRLAEMAITAEEFEHAWQAAGEAL